MKFLLIALLCSPLIFTASIFAQQIRYDRVDFRANPDWKDVLKESKRTGKVIFLDGYTSWCAPCKKMEKKVFTQAEVANYFNQKFINVKYDMEQSEGKKLKKKYGVSAFPTYLFITGNGQVVHKIIGAHFGEGEFLKYSQMAVTPGQSYVELQQRYKKGERNSDMMFSYFQALRLAGEKAKEEQIVQEYLRLMSKDHFMDESYWGIVKAFLKDPTSREFKILVENRKEIGAAIGQQEVDDKIVEVFLGQLGKITEEATTVNQRDEEKVIQLLREADFPERNVLLARALTAQHNRNGDYYDYAGLVDAMLDFRLLDENDDTLKEFDYHASIFHKVVLDKKLLKKALRWSEYACAKETDYDKLEKYKSTRDKLMAKINSGNN